jgi:hypothetical protein
MYSGRASGRQQASDIGQRNSAGLVGKCGESRVGPDDGALAFLRHDRGVPGRNQVGEGGTHAVLAACPAGGTS